MATPMFERERAKLFGIAYGMLGTVEDAEDVLQEAAIEWLRAARANPDAGVRDLVRLVAKLSIERLRSARVRRESYPGVWLPEPIAGDPRPSSTTITGAAGRIPIQLLLALDELAPQARAAYLLETVFDEAEVARDLQADAAGSPAGIGRTVTSSAGSSFPGRPDGAVYQAFVGAVTSRDGTALAAVLAPDAVMAVDGGGAVDAPPTPLRGRAVIARWLTKEAPWLGAGGSPRPVELNDRPGFVVGERDALAVAVSLDGTPRRIERVYAVANPTKLRRLAVHIPVG